MDMKSRFWSKVAIGLPDVCWEWTAAKNASGYGWFHVHTKPTSAHRVAAWLDGLIPALTTKMHVLHKCDNRLCCNPAHFFTGTNADNIADKVAKGRARGKPQHGERNGAAKLTDAQAGEIRGLYFAAQFSQSQLASRYGIRQPHVSRIVNLVRRGGVF